MSRARRQVSGVGSLLARPLESSVSGLQVGVGSEECGAGLKVFSMLRGAWCMV